MSDIGDLSDDIDSGIRKELESILEDHPGLPDWVAPVRGEPKDPEVEWTGGAPYSSSAYPLIKIPTEASSGSLWAGPLPDRRRLGFLTSQLEALRGAGVQRVVCLIPEIDLLGRYSLPQYPTEARRLFQDSVHFLDVANYSVPAVDEHFDRAVKAVADSLALGEGVLVHCGAGCGRAGMFVACVLVHGGMSPFKAIRTYRLFRTCGPETAFQVAWVLRYAKRRGVNIEI